MPLIYTKDNIRIGDYEWYAAFFDETEDMLKHLSLLYHFSFIKIENIDKEIVKLNENTILYKSTHIQQYYNDFLNEWILHNTISKNTVAVSKLSFKLLELFNEPLCFGNFTNLLNKNNIKLPHAKLSKLIGYYLKHDIIYALN